MFNRSLTSGLRPTIANLPSASAAVSTQSRGKGTLVDPFASVEAKDGERILAFLKQYKLDKFAPKFKSWEHLMECDRFVLRHIIGVGNVKERRKLRKFVTMKKVEDYFCQNKVYIPVVAGVRTKPVHRSTHAVGCDETQLSEDDLVFRVPADDRNMSSVYTSVFYPGSPAKSEIPEEADSQHQDIKETFIEGIVTHSADKDQLMTNWNMNTRTFDYVYTPEERKTLAAEQRRHAFQHLVERTEAEVEKPFIPADIESREFVRRVTELILDGNSIEAIEEIYNINHSLGAFEPTEVIVDGVPVKKEVLGTVAGPMDIRNANHVIHRIEEIYKALVTSSLKKKFQLAKKNLYVPDRQIVAALANYEKFLAEAIPGRTTSTDLANKLPQLIGKFSAQYPHADFVRDQFLLTRSPSYSQNFKDGLEQMTPLSAKVRSLLEGDIVDASYHACLRQRVDHNALQKQLRGVPLSTDVHVAPKIEALTFPEIDRDATDDQKAAFATRMESFSAWLENYLEETADIRKNFNRNLPDSDSLAAMSAKELIDTYRQVMYLRGTIDSNVFTALETPEFYAQYIGTGGDHALNDLALQRNQEYDAKYPLEHSLTFTNPINTIGTSGSPFDSADPLPNVQRMSESLFIHTTPVDLLNTPDHRERDTKAFKLDDYFSDVEEFKANHPAPYYMDRAFHKFLYGYDRHQKGMEKPNVLPIGEYRPGNGLYDDYNYFHEVEFLKPIGDYYANRNLYIQKTTHERISEAQDNITSLIDELENMHIEASRRGKIDAVNAAASKRAIQE